MTDQPQARKHLARSIVRGKSVDLRCACGNWEITQGTQKEKRAAHRAHRVEMGETVKPLKPTLVEQLAAEVRRLTAELQQAQQQNAHDPIECDHQAEAGQLAEQVKQLRAALHSIESDADRASRKGYDLDAEDIRTTAHNALNPVAVSGA